MTGRQKRWNRSNDLIAAGRTLLSRLPIQLSSGSKDFERFELLNLEPLSVSTSACLPCLVPKRVEDGGNRAYCGWSALGFVILDLADIKKPSQISHRISRMNRNAAAGLGRTGVRSSET
jgi:hypothetical protein